MKKRLILSVLLAAVLYFAGANTAESAGVLVRVDSLSSGGFNPSAGEKSVLTFAVIEDTTVNVVVRVFTMSGIMAAEKKIDGLRAGKYKFTWDGKDTKGKIAEPGFYKYELAASTANKLKTDADNTLVEVRKAKAGKEEAAAEELPPALYEMAGEQAGYSFTAEPRGHFRTSTGADTGGVTWNREEIFFGIKGGYGPMWVYDMAFFPSYTKDQAFARDNLVYNMLIGYRTPWAAFDLGYRNYLEGYYDPLRLLSDYMMGSQRLSFQARLNLLENLYIDAGIHRMMELNQGGFDVRATYDIWNGIKAGGCVITNLYPLYRNTVIGGDARIDLGGFTPAEGTVFSIQVARSNGATKLDDTHPESTFGGTAIRFEADHRLFYMSPSAGELTIKFAAQKIDGAFVADYGDIPNGIDTVGTEFGFDYFLNPNFPILRSFRNELKGVFLGNTGNTIITNKLREYISLGITESLGFIAQYEQSTMDNKSVINTAPICRNYNTFVELRYYKPGDKFETSLRATYTADTYTALPSQSENAATRFLAKYYITPNVRPYITYERISRYYGPGLTSNQDYHHIMPGFEWTIRPATRTEMAIQGGYVINNLNFNVGTYYLKLSHYFLERLSAMLTIGSQTSIDQAFRAYLEVKWEFL